MGKKATIINKSGKTPVTVYRMFLKFSMVFAVVSLFLLANGKSVVDCATPIVLAVICAAAYALCYYFYKAGTKNASSLPKFQIRILLRFICFVLGVFLIILGTDKLANGETFFGVALCIGAVAACQCLHNNTSFFSHLSTFLANFSTSLVFIALLMMYQNINDYVYLFIFAGSCICVILSEISYRAYADIKHGAKKKGGKSKGNSSKEKGKADPTKFEIVINMVTDQVIKNILLVVAVISVWGTLVITQSISVVFESNTYEKVTKLTPIGISLITVSVLIWNNFIKTPKDVLLSFDMRNDKNELRKKLRVTFGNESVAVKALDYVTAHMTRENGYSRWNGDNYYVHPIAVASILLDHTDSPTDDEIAAALLHDCAEDLIKAGEDVKEYSSDDYREYTSDYINNEEFTSEYHKELNKRQEAYLQYIAVAFNDDVKNIVLLLTKGYDSDGNPKDYHDEETMRKYLEAISENVSATKIKIADRMNNNSTLTVCSREKKKQKTEETRKYYLPFSRKASDKDRKNIEFYELAAKFFEQRIM